MYVCGGALGRGNISSLLYAGTVIGSFGGGSYVLKSIQIVFVLVLVYYVVVFLHGTSFVRWSSSFVNLEMAPSLF